MDSFTPLVPFPESGPKKMAVGDLTSDEKGTGARDNADKPPYNYIPARCLAAIIDAFDKDQARQEMGDNEEADLWWYTECSDEVAMLEALGQWEEGKDHMLKQAVACYLYSWEILDEVTRVFEFGASKYAPWNWAKGMPWSVPLECIKRHARMIGLSGQWKDKESGLSHRAHIGCNLVMLLWFADHYREGDDRPKELRHG